MHCVEVFLEARRESSSVLLAGCAGYARHCAAMSLPSLGQSPKCHGTAGAGRGAACMLLSRGFENDLLPPHTPIKNYEKKERMKERNKQRSVTGRLLSHRCHRDGAPRAVRGRHRRGSEDGWVGRWRWGGGS